MHIKMVANILYAGRIWKIGFQGDNRSISDSSFCHDKRIGVIATFVELLLFYHLLEMPDSKYTFNEFTFFGRRRCKNFRMFSAPIP